MIFFVSHLVCAGLCPCCGHKGSRWIYLRDHLAITITHEDSAMISVVSPSLSRDHWDTLGAQHNTTLNQFSLSAVLTHHSCHRPPASPPCLIRNHLFPAPLSHLSPNVVLYLAGLLHRLTLMGDSWSVASFRVCSCLFVRGCGRLLAHVSVSAEDDDERAG